MIGDTRKKRFWNKIEVIPMNPCWLWIGCIQSDGYGMIWNGSKTVTAHKFSYEIYVGPVPTGKELDHLCRERRCVNYRHLEAVTHRENVLRGNLLGDKNHNRIKKIQKESALCGI